PRRRSARTAGARTTPTCAGTERATGIRRATTPSMRSRPTCAPSHTPSRGAVASLAAIAETDEPVASALVLVDVAPHIERGGADRIGAFMLEHMEDGFADLESVADAIAAYNPHRPRPRNVDGLRKNLRQRDG